MRLEAIKNRVICEEVKEKEVVSGIEIIESEWSEAKVLLKLKVHSAGPDCEVLKEGDIIAVRAIVPKKIPYLGQEFFMIRETEVEGIWE